MKLAALDWTRVRDLLAGPAPVIAILPCGATEAHGPHLPLSTDVIISEGMAERALSRLDAQGIAALILPPLAYAPADCAAAFAGTVTISQTTAKRLIIDIAASLQKQGFACLALANSHFDPANVAMLRSAADDIAATGFPVAFPDFTRRRLAQQLTPEFISGACHAGQFETSLVLADRPELVDDGARKGLIDNPSSLVTAFSNGATSFAEAGGPDAYFGSPASASADEGQASFATMGDMLAAAIIDAIG